MRSRSSKKLRRTKKKKGQEEKARTLCTLTIRTDPPAANRALLERRGRRHLPTMR
jgi:hypothetical protein